MSSTLEIDESDLGKVYSKVLKAATEWYNLGLQLGLSDDRLDCIEKNNRGIVEVCLREMLKTWLRSSQPTWKSLINALESKSVGRRRIAKRIREKYYKTEELAPPQPSLIHGHPNMWIITLVVLLASVLASIVMCYYTPSYIVATLRYYQNLQHSKSLPLQPESFVGREEELKNMSSLVDFMSSDTRIVSIIGGPGFGKSALAVSVGHQMLSRGVTVYYVDMTEVTSMQALAEKIIEGDESIVSIHNITVKRMYKWARQLYYNTLLILDNCDDMLNANILKEELQKAVRKLLGSSEYLKILTTSRESTMHMSTFRLEWFRLQELQAKASCNLLQFYSEHIANTECEKIATLTGSVPLALKVVGSLLNQPDPPDLATIISDLENQLLKTLSPKELPVDERVNACISVSYHYLNPSVQQVGQFLANFPGSFSLDAAVGVFELTHFDSTDVTSAVNELIQRSLLHNCRNQAMHRYQFHRLIGEFFLEVQRSALAGNEDNTTSFTLGFLSHFSKWLLQLTMDTQYRVLSAIDQERHNILYFLQLLPVHHISYHQQYAAWAVNHLSKLLQYRFTAHELYKPIQNIVTYLHTNCELQMRKGHLSTETYMSLLLQLAKLKQQLDGTTQAAALLEMHQDRVEEIGLVSSHHNAILLYMRFYITLSGYYKEFGEYEKVKKCHIKILKENKKLGSCSPDSCDYSNIGIVYYALGHFEKAIDFLELSLKRESQGMIPRGKTLVMLGKAYDELHYQEKKKEALEELLHSLFPSLIRTSSEDILEFYDDISYFVSFFRAQGSTNEADALEERQLQAIKEAGFLPANKLKELNIFSKTLTLAQSSYERKQYLTAGDIAQFGLKLHKEVLTQGETLCSLKLILAKAQFFSGNFTEALESFNQAFDLIYELDLLHLYQIELSIVCPLLILREDSVLSGETAEQSTEQAVQQTSELAMQQTSLQYLHSDELSFSKYYLQQSHQYLVDYLTTLWYYVVKTWTVRAFLRIVFRVLIYFIFFFNFLLCILLDIVVSFIFCVILPTLLIEKIRVPRTAKLIIKPLVILIIFLLVILIEYLLGTITGIALVTILGKTLFLFLYLAGLFSFFCLFICLLFVVC